MTRILIINPRAMYFGERLATSIDLCVRDLVRFSRFKGTTTVVGDPVDVPFPDIEFRPRPATRTNRFYDRAPALLAMVKEMAPDVICVQEHLRTAAHLAQRVRIPVLLQRHNPMQGPKNIIDNLIQTRRYNRLAGVIFVGSQLRQDFERAWPKVVAPRDVVFNALDMTAWTPAAQRDKTILLVGRSAPFKGTLEAAQALAGVLPNYPDWKTLFMLTAVEADRDYFGRVQAVLSNLGPQATLQVQQPFALVKAQMEKAEIVLVPSIVKEAFGRTALEAHAGGAAVISSGNGGLAEVSGDHAIFLQAVTPKDISGAVTLLIENPDRRAALAAAGRERVTRLFDARAVASACDDVYIKAVKNFRAR
ncbi:MAG: glycosyltransferase family 4 protein [Xanthobacteraceae bacterium]|nr:glycosyltransferase family 4 protein [Xanthobacteraceae bacterium]